MTAPTKAHRLRVTAPMVAVHAVDGRVVNVPHGAELPADAAPGEPERLLDLGMIAWLPPDPPREAWPPPATPRDRQVSVSVITQSRTWTGFAFVSKHQQETMPARIVRLWGAEVAINPDGDVYCRRCREFMPVRDLRPDVIEHDTEWPSP